MAVQRRLAAILAADVVGYSRLMGVDEEGTRTFGRANAPTGTKRRRPLVTKAGVSSQQQWDYTPLPLSYRIRVTERLSPTHRRQRGTKRRRP